ncbi:MAG TPA: hypothetical protein VGK62_07975 [Gaiellaceae bacterium]
MRGGVFVIVAVVLLVAACGGGSRLSADAYRAQLTKIQQQSNDAQGEVAKGLQAKTVAELRRRLDAFAASSRHIGDEVAKLEAPKNAEAANAELAQGERDTAAATTAASAHVAKLKTPKAALAYLQKSLGNAKGAHELDDAVAKLKKLGYTSGS